MKIIVFAKDASRVMSISHAVLEAMGENFIETVGVKYDDEKDLFFGPPFMEKEAVCFLFGLDEHTLSMESIKKKIMEKLSFSEGQITQASQF